MQATAPRVATAESDDVALVAMLVERDPWAQRIVWQRLEPMVRRMCMRVFGPDGDCDDLMQDIFLVFFRRVHALRNPHAMKAFLVSITLITIRGVIRRKASTRMLLAPETPDRIAEPADLDARQALGHLAQILGRLDPADQAAFVLRFVEKQELATISLALGVSTTTAKRRIARALKRVTFHSRRDTALVDYVGCGCGDAAIPMRNPKASSSLGSRG